jgi:nucleoside-diphosphate-sugar epimerase
MRVVVAGAAGNLGWEVTNTLLETGHKVVALDYNIQRLEPIRSQLAVVQQIDLRQPAELQDLLTGSEVVITTVGISRPKKLSDFHDVDYLSNLNLL